MSAVDVWADMDRESGTVDSVQSGDTGFNVSFAGGMGTFIEASHGVVPKVGDAFVVWGTFGHPTRGQALNGRVLYYRTPDEQRAHDQVLYAEMKGKRAAKFRAHVAEHDQRIAALPALLRQRIAGFHARGGLEWRVNHESYELMCCEQATLLAAAFPDSEQLRAFAALDFGEQIAAFPGAVDHSGNGWGFTKHLAFVMLAHPENVPMLHGALCPLTGCKEYHCWSTVASS